MAITKDMLIGEILSKDSGTGIAEILMKSGMHCVGCPSAARESLEQAGGVHGMDPDKLVDEINEYLKGIQG